MKKIIQQKAPEITAHPFERTLGAGPYRFIDTFNLGEALSALGAGNVMGYDFAMARLPNLEAGAGTCAHCHHSISFICIVRRGDGKLYGVGSDCIAKCGLPYQELSKLQKAKKAHEKKLRDARKAAKLEALKKDLQRFCEQNAERLKADPHPSAGLSSQGKSLLDYLEWMVKNSKSVNFLGKILKKVRGDI